MNPDRLLPSSVILSGMIETIPYGVVLTTHLASFIVNILLVIVADSNALLWVLGKKEVLSLILMRRLHQLLSVGLAVSILSGVYLFALNLDYFSAVFVPAMYVKIAFVIMLVINAFVIEKHLAVVSTRPFGSLTKEERIPLFISGFVSAVGWIGVIAAAQFIGLS